MPIYRSLREGVEDNVVTCRQESSHILGVSPFYQFLHTPGSAARFSRTIPTRTRPHKSAEKLSWSGVTSGCRSTLAYSPRAYPENPSPHVAYTFLLTSQLAHSAQRRLELRQMGQIALTLLRPPLVTRLILRTHQAIGTAATIGH